LSIVDTNSHASETKEAQHEVSGYFFAKFVKINVFVCLLTCKCLMNKNVTVVESILRCFSCLFVAETKKKHVYELPFNVVVTNLSTDSK